MQPYSGLLTALIIGSLALANGPSLAEQRGSSKGPSLAKQRDSSKIRPLPSGRVLGAPLPDLELSSVDGTLVKKCVGPSTLKLSFDVQIKNVGDATAVMSQNPWAAWLRLRDQYWNVFSPYALDEFVGPPPWSLTPGQTAKFHVSRTVKQTGSGGWMMIVMADPYNWIFEINKTNNSFGIGPSQDSICK